jgi:hypothetical protein
LVDKLKFDIDDIKLVEENPNSNFSILSLDFFASGPNLHDMYVSDDTLLRTADTIKNCPIVWEYSYMMDDATSHTEDESAVGFVPEKSEITSKQLPDGRTMLTTIAYVWKKYSGQLIDIFHRDGSKPVSVEMSVLKSEKRKDGLTELLDYVFDAVTILGNFVKPAIPLANATVLQFSKDDRKEYESLVQLEFGKYDEIDLSIPSEVRSNVLNGLQLYKEKGINASSLALSVARHIVKNEKISPDKARLIHKHLSSHQNKEKNKDKPDTEYVSWQLHGGDHAFDWSKNIVEGLDNIDNRHLSYFGEKITFPYSKLEDINPSLKGIDPPVSLGQANSIAKQADAIGADKGGWGIAIKSFKDHHKIVDGHWVEKNSNKNMNSQESEKEVMSVEDEKDKKVEEMAADKPAEDTPEEEKKETPEEEKKEDKEEQKQEEEKGTEKKMSLDANLDVAALLAMLEDETEGYKSLVEEEFAKPDSEKDFAKICNAMYAKMCKMSAEKTEMCGKMAKMDEDAKAYMAENEELKKFKADEEAKRFEFEVDTTMKEVENACEMPKEEMSALRDEAKNFSIANVDSWKNLVKAKAFNFAIKGKKDDGVRRYAFAWANVDKNVKKPLWDKSN